MALAAGCSGNGNPDVLDATADVAVDALTRDTVDAHQPTDVHDVVDTGADVTPRDAFDAADLGGPDVDDVAGQDVEPADTVVDGDTAGSDVQTDIADAADTVDTPDTTIQECITDDDCAGKIQVTVCQTPYCNEDNICEAINLDDDSDCSDNSICTTGDKCVAGECVGTAVDCNDHVECTQDLCSEANYCFHRPYYGPCNDSNACTENDNCGTGTCIGTSFTCDDKNPCTTDYCDVASGCGATKLSGIKCNDQDACTKGDTCVNGVCLGTFDCDDGNPCTADGCNELGCTHEPLTGDVCDDGLICTDNDACAAGTCTGTAVVCNDGDTCTDDYCQEGAGCKTRFNTATCDDSNLCTRNDRCQYGQCKGTSFSCPVLTCMDGNNCDGNGGCVPDYSDYGTPCATDNKQCTDDICSSGTCIHPNSPTGTPCADGDKCTQTDECSNGVCVGKNPVACSVVDACKDPGTCDPATGTCTLGVLPEGSACNDGALCTKNDRCTSGACAGTPVTCIAVNDCHEIGTCNPVDGTCSEVLKGDGTPCNDKNPCTLTDTCTGGTCTGGNPVVCTALDACHVAGTCSMSTGLCSNPPAPNDTACNDGVACTTNDRCSGGFCAGTAYSCNDNLSCTDETCDGLGGCVYDVLDNWCRIDNTCILPTSVKPGNMCMVCDPARNQDGWSPITGGFCDDLDYCTYDDVCFDGTCAGTFHSCDDGKECTTDTCNGFGGCDYSITPGWCHIDGKCFFNGQQDPDFACQVCNTGASQTQFTPRNDGDSCDDGISCTHTDQCAGNVCSGTPYACNDSIECTTDSCRGDGTCLFVAIPGHCFIDGQCVTANTVKPGNDCAACLPQISTQFWSGFRDGQGCDDGSLCTEGDHCSAGICLGLPKCDDALDCTEDICDPETGGCVNPVHENYCTINGGCYMYGQQNGLNQCMRCIPSEDDRGWTATTGYGCDDSDACTENDTCDGPVCTGTQKNCDDGLDCTSDFCEYGLCGTVPNDGWCIIDGGCVASGFSPPDNPCLICDPSTNPYAWSSTPVIACDDSDACTFDDVCIAGRCAGQVYDCSDGVYCTTDTCNGDGACLYTVNDGMCLIGGGCYDAGDVSLGNGCEYCAPLESQTAWSPNDGVPCDDFDDCTSGDICGARACAGTPYDCDDGLNCTADSCNGDGTCEHAMIAGWCKIDGICFRDQTLEPGNPCSACLSNTKIDGWSPNNGQPCDDGEICTKLDTCAGGVCAGRAYTCDDGMTCTADACDGSGGCLSTLIPGNCLIDFRCFGINQFNPDNICEKCIPGTSTSQWSPADGFACNDFDPCTINTMCSGGVCGGGTKYSCDDGIICTVDSCDGSGGCGTHPLAADACLINNTCYKAGDEKPGVHCEACDPSSDQYAWTDLSLGALEICNGVDDGCDGTTDPEGASGCVNYYLDEDVDGVGVSGSFKCLCQPNETYRATVGGDCNDDNALIYAGRQEACDGLDNDCDGVTDPDNTSGCQVFFYDGDGDTWGVEADPRCLCSPAGKYSSLSAGDCNDNSGLINPASSEICNGIDDNCDGRTDPMNSPGCVTYYLDTDGDTWGDATVPRCLCAATPEFKITRPGDCDDFDAAVSPDGTETCNDVDDDCSGLIDDASLTALCPHNPANLKHGSISCTGSCVVHCDSADWDAGQPAWFNLDGNIYNGCECQGDIRTLGGSSSMTTPYDLGTLVDDDGRVLHETIRLASADEEMWFAVRGEDSADLDPKSNCDTFNLDVRFASNPGGEYEFDIYRLTWVNGVRTLVLECEGLQSWNLAEDFYTPGAGECPCGSTYETTCKPPPDMTECIRVHGSAAKNYCNGCPGMGAPNANHCSDATRILYINARRVNGATPTCSSFGIDISNGLY